MNHDTPTVSRRSVLAGTGLTLAGGGLALVVGTEDARATVTTNDVQVPSEDTYTSDTGDPYSPFISVVGEFSYNTERTPDGYRLDLTVGRDGQNFLPIDTLTGSTLGTSMSKTYEVAGAVVDHPDWDTTDFAAPGDGESVTHTLPLRVELAVLAGDGSTIIAAQDGGTVDLTVTDSGTVAEAFVQGTASVAWQDAEGDAPPV